jgi:hypothetical protein
MCKLSLVPILVSIKLWGREKEEWKLKEVKNV